MNPILVSIIIPCYNVEDYVGECLDSALAQIYRPIEIIAVDNNSTDKTLEILKKYEQKYPDLITVLEEEKQGAPAARNKGMTIAKGEWLQFLDADDILLPNKLMIQIKLIDLNPKIIMVIGTHQNKSLDNSVKVYPPNQDDVFMALAKCDLGYTVCNLFRQMPENIRPVWENKLNGAQDNDYILKYLKIDKNAIVFDFEPSTIRRERLVGQITKTNLSTFNLSCFEFQLNLLNYIKANYFEHYEREKRFYMANLYYFVYRISIYDLDIGFIIYKKYFGSNYYMRKKDNERISFIHCIGYHVLGFKQYVNLRKFIKVVSKV